MTHVATDALAVAGGWNPNTALSTHLGGRPRWSDAIAAYVPADLPRGMTAVGAAAGDFSLAGALCTGAAAGREAASAAGFEPTAQSSPARRDGSGRWSTALVRARFQGQSVRRSPA